jgi:predicted nuclease of predicted toxin-antitoxin system
MRLLLDECMPRRLKHDFVGHTVATVEEAGLKGLKNGQLLNAASGNFDVLITVDQNLPHQQNPVTLNIAILILFALSNRYQDLKPLVPKSLESLKQIRPGEIMQVS